MSYSGIGLQGTTVEALQAKYNEQLASQAREIRSMNDQLRAKRGTIDGWERENAGKIKIIDTLRRELQEARGDLNIARLERDAKLCSECPRTGELDALRSQLKAAQARADDYAKRWMDVSIVLNALAFQPHAPNDHMSACDRIMGASHPCTCTADLARLFCSTPLPALTHSPAAPPAPVCETCEGSENVGTFHGEDIPCPKCCASPPVESHSPTNSTKGDSK